MTAAAYIRVSTEEQTEYSPDSQLAKIREYAAAHGIQVAPEHIYLDEGISGRSVRKRSAFLRMIEAAQHRPPPFSCILVWKYSRFARSRRDSIVYKSMLRKECGVEVCSITEPLSDDPTALLVEALLEAMDEYYSLNLAQEVRRGMEEKFRRGGVVSRPPFGYCMGTDRFEPVPNQAEIVRMLFEQCAAGLSCAELARMLNERGQCTAAGNRFEGRTVRYLLSNPVYCGLQRRGGAEQRIGIAAHIPLVSEDLFQTVQTRLLSSGKDTVRRSVQPSLLHGLVHCSSCGGLLVLTAHGSAYQCSRYAHGQCGISHYISREALESCVLGQLHTDWNGVQLPLPEKTNSRTDYLQARLNRLDSAYEAGVLPFDRYEARRTALQREKERTELNAPSEVDLAGKNIDWITALTASAEIGNRILRMLLDRIVFDRTAGTVQLQYRA